MKILRFKRSKLQSYDKYLKIDIVIGLDVH